MHSCVWHRRLVYSSSKAFFSSFLLLKNPHGCFYTSSQVMSVISVCFSSLFCWQLHKENLKSNQKLSRQKPSVRAFIQQSVTNHRHGKAALSRDLVLSNTAATCFAAYCVAPKDRWVHTSQQHYNTTTNHHRNTNATITTAVASGYRGLFHSGLRVENGSLWTMQRNGVTLRCHRFQDTQGKSREKNA